MRATGRLAETIAATEELTQRRAGILAEAANVRRRPEARANRGAVVSLAEAARRTGRHPELLRRWCSEGRIPAVRVGRTWGLTQETVAMLMAHAARSRPRLSSPGSA